MNRITLAANNNFQLQTILITGIETCETLQATARQVQWRSLEQRRKRMWSGSFGTQWSAVLNDTNGVTSVGTRALHASRHEQRTSVAKILLQPSFQKRRRRLEQLLEYGWGLNLSSNDPDFVATPDKQVFFNCLRQKLPQERVPIHASFRLASRSTTLIGSDSVSLKSPSPKTCLKRLWSLSETRLSGASTVLPSDLTNSDDGFATGKFTLHQNWSQRSAFIKTVTDTYNCVYFFPMLSRTLKRQASNEDETVACRPQTQISSRFVA